MKKKSLFLIINGKKSADQILRNAIMQYRNDAFDISIRVTYESGDVKRFLHEAVSKGATRVAIAGGDGSVNELADAFLTIASEKRPEMAIIPMGTANDFATACTIPLNSFDALNLALTGDAEEIDTIKVNNTILINVASIGFGAEVTVSTPVELKNFLGGGAYTLMGILKAASFKPYKGSIKIGDEVYEREIIVGAICNGRQAGGGQVLAPHAFINDGLMDVLFLRDFTIKDLDTVIREFRGVIKEPQFIYRFQCTELTMEGSEIIPVNLDGEPVMNKSISYTMQPNSISLVLPEDCPLIG
ncbi:lipid kinase YegS [bacterium]|nr:lipid kinase YegS [bacterium]